MSKEVTSQDGASMDIMTDGPTLVLAGDFDVRSTMDVRTILYDLLATHDHVVVDLTDVHTVDVTALRVLAAASRHSMSTLTICPGWGGCSVLIAG